MKTISIINQQINRNNFIDFVTNKDRNRVSYVIFSQKTNNRIENENNKSKKRLDLFTFDNNFSMFSYDSPAHVLTPDYLVSEDRTKG